MIDPTEAPERPRLARDAAALSLVDIRRIDRATEKIAKAGDLTGKLKRAVDVGPPAAPAPAISAADPAPAEILPPSFANDKPAVGRLAPTPARSAPLPEPYIAPEIAPAAPEPPLPSPPAHASETARTAPLPYDDLRSADELIYYWDELRAGKELPVFASLDRTRIAISWPDTVMVNYGADQESLPQIARLSRLTGVIEFTSMVTEWILSCSRQVARLGKAMETRRAFTGTRSPHNYHLLLLPFAGTGGTSEHVLCHLRCAD